MATVKKAAPATGEDVIIKAIIQLLGVGLLALIAGISDDVGSIVVVIMAGILLIWLMTHDTQLKAIIGKVQ